MEMGSLSIKEDKRGPKQILIGLTPALFNRENLINLFWKLAPMAPSLLL